MTFIVILLLFVISCAFSIIGASAILYHDVFATYIRVCLQFNFDVNPQIYAVVKISILCLIP